MPESHPTASQFIQELRQYSAFPCQNAGVQIRYKNDIDIQAAMRRYQIKDFSLVPDDFQRATSITDWVNQVSKHSGWGYVPLGSNNLFDSLEHAKAKAVCCFDQALMMAELCLAFGFRARFIRCKPMDHRDLDSHVVAHVFIPSLHKWVLMDPTYNLYYLDTDSVPMSLFELRASIMRGESIRIYPGARYNNVAVSDLPSHTEDKLRYMAKNTFWFDSLDQNCLGAFDKYCRNDGSVGYIFLAPDGFDVRGTILRNNACRNDFIKNADMDKQLQGELLALSEQWNPIVQRMASKGLPCSYDEFWDIKGAE